MSLQAEHPGELGDHLLLHLRCDLAAVKRMVVRVDEHRGDIARDRGWMRRLEHLADVQGVEVRVVAAHPLGELAENGGEALVADPQRRVGLERRVLRLPALHGADRLAEPVMQVHRRRLRPGRGPDAAELPVAAEGRGEDLLIRALDDVIDQPAQAVDLDLDHVTWLHRAGIRRRS